MPPESTFKPSWQNFFYCLFRSPAMGAVIATNILVLLLVPLTKENAHNLLWVYWSQSMLIGILHFLKMLTYKFAPTSGTTSQDMNSWSKVPLAFFFLVHYGFFHFVYMFFLGMSGVDWVLVGKAASIFGGQMFLGAIAGYKEENTGKLDSATFMFKPYPRIIPIHMAIIIGGIFGSVGTFLVLIIIKTAFETFVEYLEINRVNVSAWLTALNEKQKLKNQGN